MYRLRVHLRPTTVVNTYYRTSRITHGSAAFTFARTPFHTQSVHCIRSHTQTTIVPIKKVTKQRTTNLQPMTDSATAAPSPPPIELDLGIPIPHHSTTTSDSTATANTTVLVDDEAKKRAAIADAWETSASSRVERRKLKKQKRKLERGNVEATEEDYTRIYGPSVSASLELKLTDFFINGRTTLRSRELQQLILWILGEEVSPKWIFVKNKPLIKQVILLTVDGLTQQSLQQNPDQFRTIFASFTTPTPQPVPLYTSHSAFNRSSVLADYLSCAIVRDREKEKADQKKKKQKLSETESITVNNWSESSPSPVSEPDADHPLKHLNRCLISVEEMKLHAYPTPTVEGHHEYRRTCSHHNCTVRASSTTSVTTDSSSSTIKSIELTEDWISFPCVHAVAPDSTSTTTTTATTSTAASSMTNPSHTPKLFAIDCEMSYTSIGLELTRATLLDDNGVVLVDSFVRPSRPILDYNTKYSGITSSMLDGVTTTIDDVRIAISRHLSAHDVLVGHSLENDLKALKLIHRNCLDSALLYTHPRGPTFKNALRYLSQKYLTRTIQTGSGGHDSREDALAALDLVRFKLKHGRDFGEPQKERESIAKVLARSNKRCTLIGPPMLIQDIVNDEPLYSTQLKSGHEIPQAIAKECANPATHLIIAPFTQLRANNDAPASTSSGSTSGASATPTSTTPSSPSNGMVELHRDLQLVMSHARPNTLILVASGIGLGASQPGSENNKQGVLFMRIIPQNESTTKQQSTEASSIVMKDE